MEEKVIKVGSKVMYRGCFGTGKVKEAKIESITKSLEKRSMDGSRTKTIYWDEREYGYFTLSDGHWCYGYQIVDLLDDENEEKEEIDVCIRFVGEVYIKGKTIEDISRKWSFMPIFSEEANKHEANVMDVILVERVDDDSYTNLTDDFLNMDVRS